MFFKQENLVFFERLEYKNRPQMSNYHIHDFYELYYLEKGNVLYFIGNELFKMKPGEMIFTPTNLYHKTNYDEKADVERILFTFPKEFIDEEYKMYITELKKSKHIQFSANNLYKIREIIKKIEFEHNERSIGFEKMQKALFMELLVTISRYKLKENKEKYSSAHKIIREAVQYISTNYNQEITLSALARKYAISPPHFSSQFKKITGVGMNDYLNITRIVASEKLLETTNLPITKIAMECGFNDSNYFASVFKKIKGITPKKYSMQHKKL